MTEVPTGPWVGVKLVMIGAAVKLALLVAVPPGAVTLIGPVVTPLGAFAVIWVEEFTVKLAAATPLNVTVVAPVKFVPVIVTDVPAGPLPGVKLVIVGWAKKLALLVAVLTGVVTEIVPVRTPVGAAAVIWVAEFTVKLAAAREPNLTAVAPVKFRPVMITEVPGPPPDGVKPEMDGPTVKVPALVGEPPGAVTAILPVVAPVGTLVVILVSETTVNRAALPLN